MIFLFVGCVSFRKSATEIERHITRLFKFVVIAFHSYRLEVP